MNSTDNNSIDWNTVAQLGAAGTLAGVGGAGLYDAHRLAKNINDWEASSKALASNITDGKTHIGASLSLQTNADQADKIFNNYHANRSKLLNSRIFGLRMKDIMNRTTPGTFEDAYLNAPEQLSMRDRLRQLFSKNAPTHFNANAAPATNASALQRYLKEVLIPSKHTLIDANNVGAERHSTRWDALSDDAKKAITEAPSLAKARENLLKLHDAGDVLGLDYFDKNVLGHASGGSGIAEMVNGSKYATGHTQDYLRYGKKALSRMRGGFGALAAAGLAAAGAAGYNSMRKDASYEGAASATPEQIRMMQLLKVLRTSGGQPNVAPRPNTMAQPAPDIQQEQGGLSLQDIALGGLGTASLTGAGIMAPEAIQGAKDLFGPGNYNVGYTYGKWGKIGDGHATPAANLQALLRDKANWEDLGLDKNTMRRLSKLKHYNLERRADGVYADLMNNPKKYNMMFDTGLGLGNLFSELGADGHYAKMQWAEGPRGAGNEIVPGKSLGLSGAQRRLRRQAGDVEADTVAHWLTDLPRKGRGNTGATFTPDNLHELRGKNNSVGITYGDESATDHLRSLMDKTNVEQWHLNNGKGISPALTRSSANFLKQYPTVDSMWDAIQQTMLKPDGTSAFDNAAGSTHNLDRLKDLMDFKYGRGKYQGKGPGKIVTIAGSGRGDAVHERTVALLEAMQRKGVDPDSVRIVPLLGNFVDDSSLAKNEKFRLTNKAAENLERLDRMGGEYNKGRVTAMGALYGVQHPNLPKGSLVKPYELIQAMADVNMASTGTSALAEAAHFGSVNVIPTSWSDYSIDEAGNRARIRAAELGRATDADFVNKLIDEYTRKAKADMESNWFARKMNMLGSAGHMEASFQDGTKAKIQDRKGFGEAHANLNDWNTGNMSQAADAPNFMEMQAESMENSIGQPRITKQVHERQKDLARRFSQTFTNGIGDHADRYARAMANRGFNMDGVVDLLQNPEKLNQAKELARQTALHNATSTSNAQRQFITKTLDQIDANNRIRRIKGLGKLSAPAAMLGLGGASLYGAFAGGGEEAKPQLNKYLGDNPWAK